MNNKHRSFISVVGVSLVLITLASGFFLHRVSGANYNDQITQITPSAKNLLGAKLEQTYALADFNGNGVTDVAVADFLSDTVSVMAGDGAGYFHSVTRLSPGGGPRAIVAADFNRDGATDLAVANFFSGGVAILLGQSDGQFRQSHEVRLHTGLTTMIGADFDADGSVDLAAANFLSGEIVILKGVGDGSFAAPSPIGLVHAVTLLLSRDTDRDGQPDVLAIGAGGNEASLFANQGHGALRYAGRVDLATALSSEREQKSMPQTTSSDQSRVLKKLYGDGQPVPAGFELSQPLVVEAGELSGQLVAGEPVTFSKLAGEARWEEGTARLTDERGQVSLAPSLVALPENHLIAAALPGSAVNVFGLLSTLSADAYTEKIKAALAQSSLAESEQQELLTAIEDKLKADDVVEAVEGLTKSLNSLTDRLPQQPGGETTATNPIELLKRLTNQVLLLGSASSVEVALTISCGQTVGGNISQAGQQDTYTFSGNAGEVVTISIAPTSGDLCPRAFLHTPSGTLLGSTTVCGSSTDPLTLPVTGTYTILVRDVFGSRTGAYDLNLQFISGRCATAIACGETKSRNFTSPAQQDAYSFSGNVDEVVTISVAPTSGDLCPRAYLYRSSGALIGTTTVCGSSTDSLRLPATGTYIIIVRDVFTSRTGAYNLNLQFVSGRCATAIACGETKSRSFTSPAQQDAYSFSGNVDEVVTISVAPTSGDLCPRAYSYRSSGALIGTTTVCGSSTDSLRLPATGTYIIIVRDVFTSRTGAYDLNLQFVSGRCAKPISCGETKSGNIASPAQQDAFSFCGTAGSSVQISIAATSGNLCPRAYLYSLSGALLGTTTVCGSTTNSIALTAGGNYTIIVRDVFTSRTGGYIVSLSCIGNGCPTSFSASGLVTSGSGAGISGVSMNFSRVSGTGALPTFVLTDANGDWTQTGFQTGTTYRVTPGRPGCTFNPTSLDFSSASTGLNFTGACPARVVRVVSSSSAPGSIVIVPIELVSQGDENALSFSLTFDASVLSYQQATLGSGATGAAFNPNLTESGQGRLGISLALPAGQRFNAGAHIIANVTFTIASGTSASSTQIGFGDQPTLREVSNVSANRLTANYELGAVTITTGIEADVAPRPNGDGRLSVIDWVQCGRFVAQLDTPAPGSEFQRADCAPKETKGDGRLSLIDWVQCGRYVALLDPMMPAGGPTAPVLNATAMHAQAETAASGPRTVRVINTSLQRGQRGAVTVELDAQGNENALSFSLNFDPAQLQFVSAAVGSGATGATLNVNSATGGRLGLVLVMPAGQVIAAGLRPIVNVTFDAPSSGSAPSTTISFGDQPIPREVSDPAANPLPAEFISGTVTFPGTVSVTSISPASPTASSSEQSITVNGSGFQSGLTVTVTAPSGSQSTLGGAQIQNVTATSFVMRVTLNAPGNWSLRVNNPDGRQSDTFSFTVNPPPNPVPILSSISPNSVTAGAATFILTANGSDFVPSSKVRWNGADLQTTFISVTQLSAQVTANLVATAGTAQVTVFNPAPGGGTSASLTFSINMSPGNPVPGLTSLSPSSAIAGGAEFTLTVNGQDFVSGAEVRWNGSPRPTTFVNSTQLTAAIPASDIVAAGTATVAVFNPVPGGGLSNALSFTITPNPPGDLQWRPSSSGLYGGGITAFAVSGATLFAGTFGGGVYRSSDNGRNWTAVNNGLTDPYVLALAVSGTTLFAGTRDGGVFRSSDNGENWTQVNNGLTNTYIHALAVSGTTLFAGTDGGVFRSSDNGQNWTAANNGLTDISVYALAVSGTTLFAGTPGGGVFRSNDNGQNWTQVNNGLINTDVRSLAVSGVMVFAGTYGGGVFRSSDSGQNWTQVNNGLTDPYVFALAVSGTTLFAGTYFGGIYRSNDNGQNWTAVNNGLTNTTVDAFAVSGTTLFAGTGGGVFRSSDNGQNWTAVNNGIAATSVRAFAVSGTTLFTGTLGSGVFRSSDNGQNWTAVNNGLTVRNVLALAVNGTTLFAGTHYGGVYRSSDNGENWTAVNNGLTDPRVYTFAVSGAMLFAGTQDGGVFRSSDNGQNWTAVNNGLTDLRIFTLAVSGTTLFAGTYGGGVFRSSDNGENWTAANNGLTAINVLDLIVSGTTLFAGTQDGGVYRSSDNGQNWTQVNSGLTNTFVHAFAVSGTTLFAGTFGGGVFRSSDNGQNWTGVNNGLSNKFVQALTVSGTTLFAGTYGGGVFAASLDTTGTRINPALSSLNPSSTTAGGSAFTLTVNGSGFVSESVVRWKGSDRITTFVSSTRLTAAIPASDIAAAGTASVTVFNPAPGGGASNALSFAVAGNPIEIIPPNPTTNDQITIRLSGEWPNTCTPRDPVLTIVGNEVRIDTSNPGQFCGQAFTSYNLTVSSGRLAAGNYLVIARHTSPGRQTELGRKNFSVTDPSPPPMFTLSFNGKTTDRVGQGETALGPDNLPDGIFTVTLSASSGARTVTGLDLVRNGGGRWNTTPNDGFWVAGAASSLDGPLFNDSTGAVNFSVAGGGSFNLFVSDYNNSLFNPGDSFTLTVSFSNGTSGSTTTTVRTLPLGFSFNGKSRDRVGPGETALSSDGAPDGTFTVTLPAGEPRTVTGLDLVRGGGGRWNTAPGDGFWVAGAASSLDDQLFNNPTGAVNFPVAGGGSFNLFASDNGNSLFNPGDSFTLTINFADGTTASASTMVAANSARASNSSTSTQCAEEDNVNITFAGKVAAFTVEATHPTYPVNDYSCTPNFDNCGPPAPGFPFTPGVFKLFDDGETVVEAVREASWWRPNGMTAAADDRPAVADAHYIRLYRRIAGTSEYPQVLVLYQDGNLRLIPHPPAGASSVCFGSSVIVGPAAPALRPIAEIASVTYLSNSKALEIKYKDGGSAIIVVQETTRQLTRVRVLVNYPVENFPFATFRSMFVTEGNADVDRIKWVDAAGAMHDDPILAFIGGEGTEWLFYRPTQSRHNTSAPDIRVRLDARP